MNTENVKRKRNFKEIVALLMRDKRFKSFLSTLYSLGASVVVLGALFKIQHWPGAGFMLSAGLITEALIFFIYAFEPNTFLLVITKAQKDIARLKEFIFNG